MAEEKKKKLTTDSNIVQCHGIVHDSAFDIILEMEAILNGLSNLANTMQNMHMQPKFLQGQVRDFPPPPPVVMSPQDIIPQTAREVFKLPPPMSDELSQRHVKRVLGIPPIKLEGAKAKKGKAKRKVSKLHFIFYCSQFSRENEFDDTENFVTKQFNLIDHNKDGCISVEEAATAIRNLGYNETEADDFIKTFDRDLDGSVTLEEFRESLSSYSMADYENMKYHYLFKKLDSDGNGALNARELRDFLALIGHSAEIPVIRDFIKELTNGTKDTLDEETFIKFLKQEIACLIE
ncbi:Calmodulin-like protein 5 [Cichlidogyrus casuarinus]|uniref:Calmodulin-like protein 5 n=1 Tax=Cichlidogyrus casuarinus TaxID=1844966 RepID=A0ABD2Q6V4_9PLAT